MARNVPARRVLFVTHRAELSGGEKSLLELLEHYVSPSGRRLGIEPTLVVPAGGALAEAAKERRIPVSFLPVSEALATFSRSALAKAPWKALTVVRGFFSAGAALRRLAIEERADLVVTNSQKAHLLAALTPALACPLIWYFRDILPHAWLSGAVAWLGRRRCRAVVFNSQAGRQALFGDRASDRRLSSVVHPGIVGSPGSAGQRRREAAALRYRLGIPRSARVIVAPGQIARWKGQDVLLEALPAIRRSVRQVAVLIAGNVVFPENESAFGESLRARAGEADLAGAVYFAGRVDPIWPALYASDLAVHCAREPEPFGRVIVEAQRAGVPVIASDAGGPREIVENEKTGLLVAPGDPAALAAAGIRLLRDRPLAARLARAGAVSSRRFTPEAAASALANVLHAIA